MIFYLSVIFSYMYITSRLTVLGSGRIMRYDMDGKNGTVLVTGLAHPNGLGIDFISKLFSFWVGGWVGGCVGAWVRG